MKSKNQPSQASLKRKEWAERGVDSRSDYKVTPAPPKPVGRPRGSLNKTREVAEALLGYNGNKVVREILRKALDPDDKDQAMMLKCCLERILPPVREVNIKQQKQTAINVIVEGVQSFVRDVVDAEIVLEGEEDLDVEGSLPEEAYEAILEEDEEDV